jgi:hypothetical protein
MHDDIPEEAMFSLESYNYYRDPRVRAEYVAPPSDGTRFHWDLCPLCRGNGTVVNPNIDAGGLDGEMMHDPDFMDDYMDGVYDIKCTQCLGRTTIAVIDEKEDDT